jgi:hypothetical protein
MATGKDEVREQLEAVFKQIEAKKQQDQDIKKRLAEKPKFTRNTNFFKKGTEQNGNGV